MKIPGLDDITANMEKFAEMLPVLESINNNLRVLAEVQIETQLPHSSGVRSKFKNRLT